MGNKIQINKLKITIFAFIILLLSGLILNFVSQGQINVLYWMIIPSIIFEELIENSYPIIADNEVINLIFIFIFWYVTLYLILNIYVVLKIIKNEETKGRNNK